MRVGPIRSAAGFFRSIDKRPPTILLPSTMSSNVGGKHSRPRKPEVSRSRHFAEGEGPVDRRPVVQTGVRDADYKNVFRENFRRPRCGCRWSIHATGSRDPQQFLFYGRAIYHLTARGTTSNSTSGITVLFPLDRIAIGTHRPCEEPRDVTRSP